MLFGVTTAVFREARECGAFVFLGCEWQVWSAGIMGISPPRQYVSFLPGRSLVPECSGVVV